MRHDWHGAMDVEMARDRYQVLLDEAEINRTIRQFRGQGDSGRLRLSQRLGDMFIALGCRLKRVPCPNGLELGTSDSAGSTRHGRNGASAPGVFF